MFSEEVGRVEEEGGVIREGEQDSRLRVSLRVIKQRDSFKGKRFNFWPG